MTMTNKQRWRGVGYMMLAVLVGVMIWGGTEAPVRIHIALTLPLIVTFGIGLQTFLEARP